MGGGTYFGLRIWISDCSKKSEARSEALSGVEGSENLKIEKPVYLPRVLVVFTLSKYTSEAKKSEVKNL